MQVDEAIFKAYDIRGVYPVSLDEALAEKVGRAYARLLKQEITDRKITIALARDMRLSSDKLSAAVTKGLIESGIDIQDIGLASTPTFYFAAAYYNFDGGIQVSASHNPPEYNGFKMVRSRSIPVSGDSGIQTIKQWVIDDVFENAVEYGQVSIKNDVLKDLAAEQKKWSDWSIFKPFKIVVDPANAMGALDISTMFENSGCEIIKINFDLDGSFPAHQADPLKEENLVQIKKAVIENQADLGIAIDGDGDRYFFIDEEGNTVRQDVLRGLIAQTMLERFPGEKMGYDVRPGKATVDLIRSAGGIPVVNKVGHSLIKEQMLKENIVFSGEVSGHYFFKQEYGTFEAPTILIGLLLEKLSSTGMKLSQLWKPHNKYSNSGEINSQVQDIKSKLGQIKEKYHDGNLMFLDGISGEYADWWFNVRPSNTEPKLRLIVEATTPSLMEQKRDELLTLIRN